VYFGRHFGFEMAAIANQRWILIDYFRNFQNGRRCHVNGQNAKKIEKHKNEHSRLLAKQKLMKLDRNNIHIQWNEISKKNRNRLDKLCRSCHGKWPP
jgi:hypothetical protein